MGHIHSLIFYEFELCVPIFYDFDYLEKRGIKHEGNDGHRP